MIGPQTQFGRKASLVLGNVGSTTALDLSALQFHFQTVQNDFESPNNCAIRVYNLSEQTTKAIKTSEYTRVVLQAGYETAGYGVIFEGDIRQYRLGRENATDTYLDILAADGDLAYNFAMINQTVAAGTTAAQRLGVAQDELAKKGVSIAPGEFKAMTGGVLPRGKVLFGLARATIRQEVQNQGSTWSINNGKLQVTPLDGYRPGEAVVLNAQTGLIGRPESTNDGMQARCLLNPRLGPGNLVKIDNASINQLVQAENSLAVAYNTYLGIINVASIDTDGIYRVIVCEHEGDTRGNAWYSNLTCLAVNPVTKKVAAYG